ncbi:MAG: hypothetical protein ACR2Q4_21965, partial [Geminicoccaceae bacterium]
MSADSDTFVDPAEAFNSNEEEQRRLHMQRTDAGSGNERGGEAAGRAPGDLASIHTGGGDQEPGFDQDASSLNLESAAIENIGQPDPAPASDETVSPISDQPTIGVERPMATGSESPVAGVVQEGAASGEPVDASVDSPANIPINAMPSQEPPAPTESNQSMDVIPESSAEGAEAGSADAVGQSTMAASVGSAGGDDRLRGGAGDDSFVGGADDDRLHGGAGDDRLVSGAGDDVLRGGAGDDRLHGGAGDDRLVGGSGDDILQGGAGDDILSGGAGDDRLHGGAGDDRLVGGGGDDVLR